MSKCVPRLIPDYLRSPAGLGASPPSPSLPGGAVGTWQRGGEECKAGIDTGVTDGPWKGSSVSGAREGTGKSMKGFLDLQATVLALSSLSTPSVLTPGCSVLSPVVFSSLSLSIQDRVLSHQESEIIADNH